MTLKICILSVEYPPVFGGVGQSVQRIARGLAQKGCQVSVVVVPLDGLFTPGLKTFDVLLEQDGDVKVYRPKPILRREDHQQMRVDLALFEWVCEFLRSNPADIIHCFYISHTGFIGGLAAQELKLPFVASVRGNDLHQNLFDPERFQYIIWTLEHAGAITFINEQLRKRAGQMANMQCYNRVIWNSVNINDFDQDAKVDEHYREIRSPVIASVGEFRQTKGIERLIEAYLGLDREATLLLVGDFTYREREFWGKYITESSKSFRTPIEITGVIPHEKILPYYALADLIVLPSLHDGCPNALLEALLCGKPVIGTNQGAIGEILRQSGAGIVLEPYSHEVLMEQMNFLIDHPQLRREMGARGKAFVHERLTIHRELEEWLLVYQSVSEP